MDRFEAMENLAILMVVLWVDHLYDPRGIKRAYRYIFCGFQKEKWCGREGLVTSLGDHCLLNTSDSLEFTTDTKLSIGTACILTMHQADAQHVKHVQNLQLPCCLSHKRNR